MRRAMFTVLAAGTLAFSVLRGFRLPNEFAKVHWLLDYRFGFVKRGLVGEALTLATGLASMRITDRLIVTLATAAFVLFCVVLAAVVGRIVHRSGWSTGSMLVGLVFLSSPFVVMSAHINGYLDNIVIILGVASIFLLLRGRSWAAAGLLVVALLVHENAIVLAFPAFCLAWLLANSQRHERGDRLVPFLPLLVPVGAFGAMALFQELAGRDDFVTSFAAHLRTFSFVNPIGAELFAAPVFDMSFSEGYRHQEPFLAGIVSDPGLYGLIVPTCLAILVHVVHAYRVRARSAELLLVVGVIAAPQVMHLVAWDTARIATYSILAALLVLWIYAEVVPAGEVAPVTEVVSLAALVANVVMVTPLMDGEVDAVGLPMRLVVLVPLMAGSLFLVLRDPRAPGTSGAAIQGVPLARLRPRWPSREATAEAYASGPTGHTDAPFAETGVVNAPPRHAGEQVARHERRSGAAARNVEHGRARGQRRPPDADADPCGRTR